MKRFLLVATALLMLVSVAAAALGPEIVIRSGDAASAEHPTGGPGGKNIWRDSNWMYHIIFRDHIDNQVYYIKSTTEHPASISDFGSLALLFSNAAGPNFWLDTTDDKLHLIYYDTANSQALYKTCTTNCHLSGSWTQVAVVFSGAVYGAPDIALHRYDATHYRAHFVYVKDADRDNVLYKYWDSGTGLSAEITIPFVTGTYYYPNPTIDVDYQARVHVGARQHHTSTTSLRRCVYTQSSDNGASWKRIDGSTAGYDTLAGATSNVQSCGVVVAANNKLHMAFQGVSNYDYYGYTGALTSSSWTTGTVSTVYSNWGNVGGDAAGNMYYTYSGRSGTAGDVYYKRYDASTGLGAQVILNSYGNSGNQGIEKRAPACSGGYIGSIYGRTYDNKLYFREIDNAYNDPAACNTPPTTPTTLTPDTTTTYGGPYELGMVPIVCSGSTDADGAFGCSEGEMTGEFCYELEAYWDTGEGTGWYGPVPAAVGNPYPDWCEGIGECEYYWDVTGYSTQTGVDLRCRAFDSVAQTSDWITNLNVINIDNTAPTTTETSGLVAECRSTEPSNAVLSAVDTGAAGVDEIKYCLASSTCSATTTYTGPVAIPCAADNACTWWFEYKSIDTLSNTETEHTIGPIEIDRAPPNQPTISTIEPSPGGETTSIDIAATAVSDVGCAPGSVEYYFTCVTGGCHDRTWGTSNTYTDTGLTPGEQYTYTVKARDSFGFTTADSSTQNTWTWPATPGAPTATDLNAPLNSEFTGITLVIDPSTNGASVTYTIREDNSGDFLQADGTLGAGQVAQMYSAWGGASGIDLNLPDNAAYTFSVMAANGGGDSTGYSGSSATIGPIDRTAPATPDLTATADLVANEVDLTWDQGDAGLVLYMPFEGGVAEDWGPQGVSGALTGATVATGNTGPYTGGALDFAAEADKVLLTPVVDLGADWTISAWAMYPFAAAANWNTLARGTAEDHQIIVQKSTGLLGTYINNGGGFHSSGFDTDGLVAGWYHIAAVGTGTTTTFYIDGEQVGISPAKSTSDVYTVGNHHTGTQQFGIVDEFRVYSTPLSEDDIRNDMNSGLITHGLYRNAAATGAYEPVGGLLDEFTDGDYTSNPTWTVTGGTWAVSSEKLTQSDASSGGWKKLTAGSSGWTDYVFSAKVKPTSITHAYPNVGLILRAQDVNTYYGFFHHQDDNTWRVYDYQDAGYIFTSSATSLTMNEWHELKAKVVGSSLKFYVDGVLIADLTDSTMSTGYIGLLTLYTAAEFDDIKVTPLIADDEYGDSEASDTTIPPNGATPTFTGVGTGSMAVNWASVTDTGDTWYHYIKAFDDAGNDENMFYDGGCEKTATPCYFRAGSVVSNGYTVDSSVAYTGDYSLRQDTSASTRYAGSDFIIGTDVEANTEYIAECMVKTALTAGYTRIWPEHQFTTLDFTSTSGTTDWTRIYTVFRSGASGDVRLLRYTLGTATGQTWWDDCELHKISKTTVTTGTDSDDYQADNTVGIDDGGTDSGWVASGYVDGGLSPNTEFCYRVRARDNGGNIGGYGSQACKHTHAVAPTLSYTSQGCSAGTYSCTLTPDMGTTVATEYYIEPTTSNGGESNSGWVRSTSQTTPTFTDTGLTAPRSTYSYKIKARNDDTPNDETGWSSTVDCVIANQVPVWTQAITDPINKNEDDGWMRIDSDLSVTGGGQATDCDGDTLTFTVLTENAAQVDCKTNGTNGRELWIRPADNWFGAASCTIRASDTYATADDSFTINVASVNDLPTIEVTAPPGGGASADASYTVNWTASDIETSPTISCYGDADAAGWDQTYTCFTGSTNDGTESCDVSAWATGSYYIWCEANDGEGGTAKDYSPGQVTIGTVDVTMTAGTVRQVHGGNTGVYLTGPASDTILGQQWLYKAPFTVDNNQYARTDYKMSLLVDFTKLFDGAGGAGTSMCDNCYRVVEVSSSGQVIGEKASRFYHLGSDYNALTKAAGRIDFVLDGATTADATRYFWLVFDGVDRGAPTQIPLSQTFFYPETDLNGDGVRDIITAGHTGEVNVINGVTKVVTNILTSAAADYPALAIADTNGDGTPELIIAPYTGTTKYVYHWTGSGYELLGSFVTVIYDTLQVTACDIDMDGLDEIIIPGYGQDRIEVWGWTGSGYAEEYARVSTGQAYGTKKRIDNKACTVCGDVDMDGTPEIVSAQWYDEGLSVISYNGVGLQEEKWRDIHNSGTSGAAGYVFDNEWAQMVFGDTDQPRVYEWSKDGMTNTGLGPDQGSNHGTGSIMDWDQDGRTEVAIGEYGGAVRVYNVEDTGTFNLELGPIDKGSYSMQPMFGDIDHDGAVELVAAWNNDLVYVFDTAGAQEWVSGDLGGDQGGGAYSDGLLIAGEPDPQAFQVGAPRVTWGEAEAMAGKSEVMNDGSRAVDGKLLMKVQKNTGSWVDVATVSNEPILVGAGSSLDLGVEWANAGAWNTGAETTGPYRVYIALTDDGGTVFAKAGGGNAEVAYDFGIDTDAPVVTEAEAAVIADPTPDINEWYEYMWTVGTDEPALCRYSAESEAWASMMPLDTQYATSHYHRMMLFDENAYTYYIKCRDVAGNEGSLTLSFDTEWGHTPIPSATNKAAKMLENAGTWTISDMCYDIDQDTVSGNFIDDSMDYAELLQQGAHEGNIGNSAHLDCDTETSCTVNWGPNAFSKGDVDYRVSCTDHSGMTGALGVHNYGIRADTSWGSPTQSGTPTIEEEGAADLEYRETITIDNSVGGDVRSAGWYYDESKGLDAGVDSWTLYDGQVCSGTAEASEEYIFVIDDYERAYMVHSYGDGSFSQLVYLGDYGNRMPRSSTMADFDNDGDYDVIINDYGAISMLRKTGYESFTEVAIATVSGWTNNYMMCTAAADFNNDGNYDFIAAPNVISQVYRFLGDGTGGFTYEAIQGKPSGSIRECDAADFDMDGNMDFAISGNGGTVIWYGLGTGLFEAPVVADGDANTWDSYSFAAADFTGDGLPDFIRSEGGGGAHSLFKNMGGDPATFSYQGVVFDTDDHGGGGAFDFDHDGDQDYVVSYENHVDRSVDIFLNDGDGTSFTRRQTLHYDGISGLSYAVAAPEYDPDIDTAIKDYTAQTANPAVWESHAPYHTTEYESLCYTWDNALTASDCVPEQDTGSTTVAGGTAYEQCTVTVSNTAAEAASASLQDACDDGAYWDGVGESQTGDSYAAVDCGAKTVSPTAGGNDQYTFKWSEAGTITLVENGWGPNGTCSQYETHQQYRTETVDFTNTDPIAFNGVSWSVSPEGGYTCITCSGTFNIAASGAAQETAEAKAWCNTLPPNPTTLTPTSVVTRGGDSPLVAITCASAVDADGDSITYQIEANYSGGWHDIGGCSSGSCNWDVSLVATQTGVDLRCRAWDGYGWSVGYKTNNDVVDIDNSAPSPVSTDGAPADWTEATSPATVTCSDVGTAGCDTGTYKIYTTGAAGACPQDYGSYTLPSPSDITSHVWVCAAAKDTLGNIGYQAAGIEFKVDQAAPPAPVLTAVQYTNVECPTFQWTEASDTGGSGIKDYELEVARDTGWATDPVGTDNDGFDTGWIAKGTYCSAGTCSYTPSTTHWCPVGPYGGPDGMDACLCQGKWVWRVRARDNALAPGPWAQEI